MGEYMVRAARCDHRATEEEIYGVLARLTAPLTRAWEKLERARKVVIKVNMSWPPERIQRFEGRRRELVDEDVCRSVLRLLRERTDAELVATDTNYGPPDQQQAWVNYRPILEEFGVGYVDSNQPPFAFYDVPGGGLMFRRYLLSACFQDADAVVSVAKMKSHGFTGITLCLKNLFGLPPMPPHGRPRHYFHHLVRLAYVLPDLGLITQPCLNIIDALVGQSGSEWGGEGRIGDTLIAGDHVIATDACGAWLMGHDPASDWPTPPFRRDRNPILVAAEHGFGTVDLNEIDFETEVQPPVADFDTYQTDPPEVVRSWLVTGSEQGLFYRDHQAELAARYAGELIYLQDGEVIWHGHDLSHLGSRRQLSGAKKDSALWLKFVDPEETEGEHFEVYEQRLARLR